MGFGRVTVSSYASLAALWPVKVSVIFLLLFFIFFGSLMTLACYVEFSVVFVGFGFFLVCDLVGLYQVLMVKVKSDETVLALCQNSVVAFVLVSFLLWWPFSFKFSISRSSGVKLKAFVSRESLQ